jgi:hypothetical protein
LLAREATSLKLADVERENHGRQLSSTIPASGGRLVAARKVGGEHAGRVALRVALLVHRGAAEFGILAPLTLSIVTSGHGQNEGMLVAQGRCHAAIELHQARAMLDESLLDSRCHQGLARAFEILVKLRVGQWHVLPIDVPPIQDILNRKGRASRPCWCRAR